MFNYTLDLENSETKHKFSYHMFENTCFSNWLFHSTKTIHAKTGKIKMPHAYENIKSFV